MKRIIWQRPDGSVSMTTPRFHPDETEAETLARVTAEEQPNEPGATAYVFDDADLPPDQEFFDAWFVDQGRIDVDVVKAREARARTIANRRAEKLQEIDREIANAEALKDTARRDAAAAKRIQIRDIAQNIDLKAARNLAEIKGIWPAELERRLTARGR